MRFLYMIKKTLNLTVKQLLLLLVSFCVLIFVYFWHFRHDVNELPWPEDEVWDPQPRKPLHNPESSPMVVIFEEHHEAIAAWFDALATGAIVKAMTLIHIDAHSDNAPPTIISNPDFPLFRLPRTMAEAGLLIQNNDDFIFGAMSTGLVADSIWIYPHWANDTSEALDNVVLVGSATKNSQEVFCVCERTSESESKCHIPASREPGSEDIIIPDEDCVVRTKYRTFSMSDKNFDRFLRENRGWSQTLNPILLDIDEDFFGVELVGHKLAKVGINRGKIEDLNELLEVLCPTSPEQEEDIDTAWTKIIDCIIERCSAAKFSQLFESLTKLHFCQPIHGRMSKQREVLRSLATGLSEFNRGQLTELRRVGVCLSGNLLQFAFFGAEEVHPVVCIGKNFPNDSQVEEYLPTEQQLQKSLNLLKKNLKRLPKPNLVTLCRSSRDGYVPRNLQNKFENSVLDILKEVYKLDSSRVVYSQLLMKRRS